MNKQLSDQELGQMVQTIAEQYASTPAAGSNAIKKRFLIAFGLFITFISLTLLIINLVSKSIVQSKHSPSTIQVMSFEDPISPEITSPTPPPIIPTINPVQIPEPSQPTPQMLPLPIPDNPIEIRPLLPPSPLPQSSRILLEDSNPPKDDSTLTKEKKIIAAPASPEEKEPINKEESNSLIEIQLSD